MRIYISSPPKADLADEDLRLFLQLHTLCTKLGFKTFTPCISSFFDRSDVNLNYEFERRIDPLLISDLLILPVGISQKIIEEDLFTAEQNKIRTFVLVKQDTGNNMRIFESPVATVIIKYYDYENALAQLKEALIQLKLSLKSNFDQSNDVYTY